MDLCDYQELQFFDQLEIQQEWGLFLNLDTSILHERLCRDSSLQ